MRKLWCSIVSLVMLAGICAGCAHAAEGEPALADAGAKALPVEVLDQIGDQLCEIYSQIPARRKIKINSAKPVRIPPVVVHRCQTVIFEVQGGTASLSLTDKYLADANQNSFRPDLDGRVRDTIVLWISEGEPASLLVPEDYPDDGEDVEIRYYVECFDAVTGESYQCEGTSPPRVIIPPVGGSGPGG